MRHVVQVVVSVLGFAVLSQMSVAVMGCSAPEAPTEAPSAVEAVASVKDRIRTAAPKELEAWEIAIAEYEKAEGRLRTAVPAEFGAWRASEEEADSADAELSVADAGWTDTKDEAGQRVWEKAAERRNTAHAALDAAKQWVQASAPIEFAAFEAAEAEMRAAAFRATAEALRASAPVEFAALEGLDAALKAAGAAVRATLIPARNEDGHATAADRDRAFEMARAKRDSIWQARKRALEALRAAVPLEYAAWDEARRAVQ